MGRAGGPYEGAVFDNTDDEYDAKEGGVEIVGEIGGMVVEDMLEEFHDKWHYRQGDVISSKRVGEIFGGQRTVGSKFGGLAVDYRLEEPISETN